MTSPKRPSSPHLDPHSRARRHLLRLLTSATAGVTLLGCGSDDSEDDHMICDPTPPPFTCDVKSSSFRNSVSASGKWKSVDGGSWAVQGTILDNQWGSANDRLVFKGIQAENGTIVESFVAATSVTFTVVPEAGKDAVLIVSTTCDQADLTLRYRLSVAGQNPAEGAVVKIGLE